MNIINEKHLAKLGIASIMYILIAAEKLDQPYQENRFIGRSVLTGLIADKHFTNSIRDTKKFQIL